LFGALLKYTNDNILLAGFQ